MIVKLLTKHHLEFLSLTGGYKGSSESTLVKMSHCWKSHVQAHSVFYPLTSNSSQNPPLLLLSWFLVSFVNCLTRLSIPDAAILVAL